MHVCDEKSNTKLHNCFMDFYGIFNGFWKEQGELELGMEQQKKFWGTRKQGHHIVINSSHLEAK